MSDRDLQDEDAVKETPDDTKGKQSIGREIFSYVKIFVVVIVVVLLLQNFVIINAEIPSESMEKTIMTGDKLIGNRLAYIKNGPKRFDVVIFKYPDDEKELYIKRIVGLPGETIDVIGGKVYIDGSEKPLDDSFCLEVPDGSGDGHFVVPEDSYFMMGDNRNNSNDSRFWNNPFVHKEKILGEAMFRYWPLNKMKKII